MTKDSVTYPPLDTAKTVGKNVWIVDSGPMMAAGMIPLPVRMTVIQLSGGDLLLHSPTQYHEQLHRELEAIGPVKHLVAPNVAHWTFVQAWQSHLPDATTWGAQGLRQRSQVKRSGLRLDHDLGAVAPAAWADEIEHIAIDGMGGFSEICLFHRPSRTLILTDIVQNLEVPAPSRLLQGFAKVIGVHAPEGKAPIYLRVAVKLKGRTAREAGRRLLALKPSRVIFAHGRWFDREASHQLARALDWLI